LPPRTGRSASGEGGLLLLLVLLKVKFDGGVDLFGGELVVAPRDLCACVRV
jgi:hypothetical protein